MSFSKMDSIVLEKAGGRIDNLKYTNLMKPNGATGYDMEVIKTPAHLSQF